MSGDGNDLAAEFIRGLTWQACPPAVQQRARLCLLDGLGAALAGTLTPVSRITAGYAVARWPGDGAAIFRHGLRAKPAGAAFANAWAANALDVDDDAIFTRGHPGAQLVPAVLAVAEQQGASGQAVLEALVVGYEVAIRAGRCWHAEHDVYQACGSWGSLGCAAAVARLLGLSHSKVKHALGIADYHAPNAPMMRAIQHPAMVKHAIGWGAMNGVVSAELAQRGFTGVPSLLGFERYREWVLDLGQVFWMADWVFYKEWCSCAWGHAACQAAWQVVQEQHLDLEQVSSIRVRTFAEALHLYAAYPANTEQAQFSLKWPLACLLLDGRIGPEQVLENRLGDPRVRAVFDKIEVTLDPAIDELYKHAQEMDLRMYSAVEFILADGRQIASGLVERRADRFDQAALENKFRWLAGYVLEQERLEPLVATLRSFECLADVRPLLRSL